MVTYYKLMDSLGNHKARSAWSRGVKAYAIHLMYYDYPYEDSTYDNVPDPKELEKILLNGAKDWKEYSWNGCSLIYNHDIAKALCTPSEFKKTKEGMRRPNAHEDWLDVQARALYQAFRLIESTYHELSKAVA